jgi:hypothetical protein
MRSYERSIPAAILAILFAIPLSSFAHAQIKSKAAVQSEINVNLPDNKIGFITPSIMRGLMTDVLNSYLQGSVVNAQTGTTYTIQCSDMGSLVTFNNSSPVSVTLPSAATACFNSNWLSSLKNNGSGTITIAPLTGTINGSGVATLGPNQSLAVISDGTNWQTWGAAASTNPWTIAGSQIYYTGGNVGIGTASPQTSLEVAGTIRFDNLTNGCLLADSLGNININSCSAIVVQPASRLATVASLPSNTYSNGSLGVGATLTATANGALSIDSVAVNINDVVLIKNEATQANDGIFIVTQTGSASAPYILTRASYFDTSANMVLGSYTFIQAGSTNTNSAWSLGQTVVSVGTSAVIFNQFSNNPSATWLASSGSAIYYNLGNVGFNTSSPGYLADVNGTFHAAGNSTFGNGGTGTSPYTFVFNGTSGAAGGARQFWQKNGNDYWQLGFLSSVIGTGTSNDLTMFSQVSGTYAFTAQSATGYIGINNNNPGANLDINGSVRIDNYANNCLGVNSTSNVVTACGRLSNVIIYGADPTGSADAAPAFQAAVNDMQAGTTAGVFIPCGTYKLNSSPTVSSGTSFAIFGQDKSCVIININYNGPAFTVFSSSSIYYGTFLGITCQWSGSPSNSTACLQFDGSTAVYISYWEIGHLRCLGLNTCINNTRNVNVGGEAEFDWNHFFDITTNANGVSSTNYAFYTANGSGTGNVYDGMNLVVGAGGFYWGGTNNANVGDIMISNIELGSNTGSGVAFEVAAGSYRGNITISSMQCDAGISRCVIALNTTNMSLIGLAYSGPGSATNVTTGAIRLYCGSQSC